MRHIALSWEDWRRVIFLLREMRPPYVVEHANVLETRLEQPNSSVPENPGSHWR